MENFDDYMLSFKKESLKSKQKIVYEQLKMLAGLTNDMCKKNNIPNEIIVNRELLDMNNSDYTEDDFTEAILVLINSIQNSICDYSIGINSRLNNN